MDVGELVLYFLLVPAAAYGVGAMWMRVAMHRAAETQLGLLREGLSRFLIFSNVLLTPVLFGFVVFLQLLTLNLAGGAEEAVRALGWTWAVSAPLTVLSQAWIVVRRGAAAYGPSFSRVLVLMVVPETVALFLLVIAFQVIARVKGALSLAEAAEVTRGCYYMMVGSIAAPVEAVLFNLSKDLEGPAFGRTVVRGTAAEVIVVVALVLSFPLVVAG